MLRLTESEIARAADLVELHILTAPKKRLLELASFDSVAQAGKIDTNRCIKQMTMTFDHAIKDYFNKVLVDGWTPDLHGMLAGTAEDDFVTLLYKDCFISTKAQLLLLLNQQISVAS